MTKLTHFDSSGHARMVDVGGKSETGRVAVAEGRIHMQGRTLDLITHGEHKKGDVLGIARVAGIMAAKKTPELIPLCHPLSLARVEVDFDIELEASAVTCRATVASQGRTGVEMEALTAVQISLLTIYDMCKAIDRGMTIDSVRLVEKSGGKSGTWKRE